MCTWLVAMFASSPLYFSQSLKTLTMANITLCGEVCSIYRQFLPVAPEPAIIIGFALDGQVTLSEIGTRGQMHQRVYLG